MGRAWEGDPSFGNGIALGPASAQWGQKLGWLFVLTQRPVAAQTDAGSRPWGGMKIYPREGAGGGGGKLACLFAIRELYILQKYYVTIKIH